MFRLVYRPRTFVLAVLVSLFALSSFGLLFYIVTASLTSERLIMCVLGVILFAVLLNVYGWPVTWEVGPENVRKVVGRKAVAEFPIRDIATVGIFVLGTNEVFQSIELRNSRGDLLLRIEKDHLAIQDVREFYETLAYRLPSHVTLPANPYGWRPRLPEVPERRLPTGKTNWRRVSGHLASSVIHGAGLGLAIAGAEKGWISVFIVGVVVFVAGISLFALSYTRDPSRIRWR